MAQFNLLQNRVLRPADKKLSRKCICSILENIICRLFKFNVSFSITQSTLFIADTGLTSESVSAVAKVCNSGRLIQSNICNLFLPGV